MQNADIKVGGEYALREARTPGTPLQHVRIVEHIRRNKWRAEWIEPNPGLKDYVESQHLVVPGSSGRRSCETRRASSGSESTTRASEPPTTHLLRWRSERFSRAAGTT